MKITVFIPCYNAGRFLSETLESILNQTCYDFEVLIVDDGSTDNSKEIIMQFIARDSRIRALFHEQNKGIAFTRNEGLRECKSEYIAIMDADDIAVPQRLKIQAAFLDKNPDIGAVGGQYILIDEQGKVISKKRISAFEVLEVKMNLILHNVIANSSVMFRKSIVEQYCLSYKPSYTGLEDYRFWCEFALVSKIVNLPTTLLYYRIVKNGISKTNVKINGDLRNRNFDEIHKYMIHSNGFVLEKNDEEQLLQVLRDNPGCNSVWEWIKIFRIRKILTEQAEHLDQRYAKYLKKAFRKVFKF